MYVRKFEADTLEEALGTIKKELGPDAIILKTVTNKGLKGAFKKKKIEITAAISEKNYSRKAKVDNVLNTEQKDKFYQNNSSYISNMINSTSNEVAPKTSPVASGYGAMGLNKPAQARTIEQTPAVSQNSSLDDFLSASNEVETESEMDALLSSNYVEEVPQKKEKEDTFKQEMHKEEVNLKRHHVNDEVSKENLEINKEIVEVIESQRNKIDELEKRLYELSQNVSSIDRPKSRGVSDLVSTLRTLDIDEKYTQALIRKVNFELSDNEQEDADAVFEFALKEMINDINTDLALFSKTDNEEVGTVTVVVSDMTSGQSTMLRKIASLKDKSIIIRNREQSDFKENITFSEKFFNIETHTFDSVAEIVQATRENIEKGVNVFIDYKSGSTEVDDVKKFFDGLRRSFENVEILISLSSIHSELYNKKVLNRYAKLSDGLVITHLDQCLNYGALFNIAIAYEELPFKFFGTGDVVPDDIENATAERVLAGVFQLN